MSKLKIIVKNLILFKKVTYICISLIFKTRNYESTKNQSESYKH